jgi:hypothetical protein
MCKQPSQTNMLKDAALNQIIGAATAGVIGVGAALFLKWIDDRRRRKAVARAVLQEMLQTVNALLVALPIIERASKVQDTAFPGHRVQRKQFKRMRPIERKIFSAIGEGLGALSDNAISNAVAFNGTIDVLDRQFDDFWYDEKSGYVSFDSCAQIADGMNRALSAVKYNVLAVIDDAYGSFPGAPQSTQKVVKELEQVILPAGND